MTEYQSSERQHNSAVSGHVCWMSQSSTCSFFCKCLICILAHNAFDCICARAWEFASIVLCDDVELPLLLRGQLPLPPPVRSSKCQICLIQTCLLGEKKMKYFSTNEESEMTVSWISQRDTVHSPVVGEGEAGGPHAAAVVREPFPSLGLTHWYCTP